MHQEPYTEVPLRDQHGDVVAHALIDAADAADVLSYRWYRANDTGYALRAKWQDGRTRKVYLHRHLLGLERGDRRQVDHVNRDRLDNRRSNLRVVTLEAQRQNTKARSHGRAGIRGVSYNRRLKAKPWQARVTIDGVVHRLGHYATKEEAGEVAAAFRAKHMPWAVD